MLKFGVLRGFSQPDVVDVCHLCPMPRIARLVVPGFPHHITQRGNRKMRTFFSSRDYQRYIGLIADEKNKAGVEIWAYCLMPNHVHIIAVPEAADSFCRLFRSAHQRYTRYINMREEWQGHLWQERFHSFVMDEQHLIAAVRYVEMNPVRAGLVDEPEQWRWSSVHAHLRGEDCQLVSVVPMLALINDWPGYLGSSATLDQVQSIRRHSRTGRPAGDDSFLRHLEDMTGRRLRRRRPGPKPGRRID